MAGFVAPEIGAGAGWMRHALLVPLLASTRQEGAMAEVAGAYAGSEAVGLWVIETHIPVPS